MFYFLLLQNCVGELHPTVNLIYIYKLLRKYIEGKAFAF